MSTMPLAQNTITFVKQNDNLGQGPNNTLLSMSQQATLLSQQQAPLESNNMSPHYFLLENSNEPIYDAVYQNITDGSNT